MERFRYGKGFEIYEIKKIEIKLEELKILKNSQCN